VIGLANAGTDLQNCIKQAAEFGISKSGVRLATLLMIINDVVSLGQDVCQGLVLTNSFYWDLSPETRAWTARYLAKMEAPPNEYNAACYAAVTHWLKAVKAAGTLDADAVAAKMRDTPLNDFYNKDVHIQADGCVPHAMYLWQVKDLGQSNQRFDLFSRLATIPSPEAYPPPGLFGCPLVPA
jgi:branched-chain amino acid transport system substrate-binding protein